MVTIESSYRPQLIRAVEKGNHRFDPFCRSGGQRVRYFFVGDGFTRTVQSKTAAPRAPVGSGRLDLNGFTVVLHEADGTAPGGRPLVLHREACTTPLRIFTTGSATTLADVLARHFGASLTAGEQIDVVDFLRSIPFPSASPRRRAAAH